MSRNNSVFFPKGYAVWLKNHYPNISEKQIMDFCGICRYTLDSILLNNNINEDNPVECGQLTIENIEECAKDHNRKLINISPIESYAKENAKNFLGQFQKRNKINAIVWVFHNKLDADLTLMNKIFRSRITYLEKIKQQVINKELPEYVTPMNPVEVDFCTLEQLNQLIN